MSSSEEMPVVILKTAHQQRVEEFMRKAGQELPTMPIIPSLEVRLLRARLILEEALETIEGLGFEVDCPDLFLDIEEVTFREHGAGPNLEAIADGCADISVVTIGTLSACGISDVALLKEVDESNLRKFGDGGHKREDGKWIKPPDWQPPDIKKVLLEQGYI